MPEPTPPRFPWRVTAIVAIIVIATSVVIGLLLSRDRVDSRPTAPTAVTASSVPTISTIPSGQDRQVTLLLTVRDDEGQAVSSVLIGVGGHTGQVSELMLPRALLLPTTPPMRLSQASDPTGSTVAVWPLQTLLGVQIDAAVDLDRLAWGGLVDATGSRVDATVAKQVGSFDLVVDQVLAGLPPESSTTSELLIGLGSMARTTVTNEDAGRLMALIGRGLREHRSVRAALPVTYVRAGDERAAVVKRDETDALVAKLFPEALLQTGHDGPLRVVLQRAGATVGAEVAARLTLASAGIGVVPDRSQAQDVAATIVMVPGGSPQAVAAGRQVAAALGLPPSAVVADASASAIVDARVLLGPDLPVTAQ